MSPLLKVDVLLNVPNAPLFSERLRASTAKFVWLRALKKSARYSSFSRSCIRKDFAAVASKLIRPGP